MQISAAEFERLQAPQNELVHLEMALRGGAAVRDKQREVERVGALLPQVAAVLGPVIARSEQSAQGFAARTGYQDGQLEALRGVAAREQAGRNASGGGRPHAVLASLTCPACWGCFQRFPWPPLRALGARLRPRHLPLLCDVAAHRPQREGGGGYPRGPLGAPQPQLRRARAHAHAGEPTLSLALALILAPAPILHLAPILAPALILRP